MNGILLVDKPQDLTSHDVVYRVRKHFGIKSVGHAGTLDPLATGLLVLLIGEGTKLSDFFLKGDKGYHVTVQLGIVTDTDDITGEVIETNSPDYEGSRLEPVIKSLTGKITLPIPIYSAVKRGGKKLYEYARNKQEIQVPLREMDFSEVELMEKRPGELEFFLGCGKGSYVRAWAKELGARLKTGGTVKTLRRTFSAPFAISQAITLDRVLELESAEDMANLESWVPMQSCLSDWPSLKVEGKDEKLLKNGQISRKLERYLEVQYGQGQFPGIRVLSRREGRLISLIAHEKERDIFKIRRVFNS